MNVLKHLIANSIYPLAAFAVSMILTRICIAVLPHLGYMDMPSGRHIHKKPVPRAGGLGFILAFWFAAALYAGKTCGGDFMLLIHQPIGEFLLSLAGASVVLFFTGLYDDRFDMPSVVKLLLQISAGVIIYLLGGGIRTVFDYTLPNYLSLAVTVMWTIGIVNAFNLIDGLDGLAAGLASISSICIALWILINGSNVAMALLLMIFCASCLGFLVYNFSPARIFMGDTGSMFLGLFLAMTSMDQCSRPAVTVASLLVPLVAVGVPIFDVILAIWRRSVRRYGAHMLEKNGGELTPELEHGIEATGEKILPGCKPKDKGVMDADQDHLHHRIFREAHNKTSRAVLLMYSLSVVFSLGAIGLTFVGRRMPALALLLILIAVFFTLRLANIELLASMTVVAQGVRFPRKSFILTALHPILDFSLVTISFFMVYFLVPSYVRNAFDFRLFVALVVPYFMVLSFSGIYRTYWLRAGIDRYYQLMKLLLLSAVLSFAILDICFIRDWVLRGIPNRSVLTIFLMQSFLSVSMIMGERFLLHYLECFAIRSYYVKNTPEAEQHSTLLYGGGLGCRMYISSLYSGRRLSCPFRILGIVDDNPSLQKLNVYGFRVLGTSLDLESIHAKTKFDTIVLTTTNLPVEVQKRVCDFAAERGIRITMYVAQEYAADQEFLDLLRMKAVNPLLDEESGASHPRE